ncbi:unnamed protein product [Penicillium olsonii]|nr:unnamed protein product [Penicillium olsonii]
MKFTMNLIVTAVLIASAIAAPFVSNGQPSGEISFSSRFDGLSSKSRFSEGLLIRLDDHPNEDYSANWAGVYLNGTGYKAATGQFKVPKVQLPPYADPRGTYCASIWVGIDGATCTSAILQSGIDFCITNNSVTYGSWYEWFPDYSHQFTNISLAVDDIVKVTVEATSLNTGSAVVENLSNGETVRHEFSGNEGNGQLCEWNAEWIVEDFITGSYLVPFVKFDDVTISNAQATTTDGKIVGLRDAITVDIRQQKILTSSSHTDDSLTVQYVG